MRLFEPILAFLVLGLLIGTAHAATEEQLRAAASHPMTFTEAHQSCVFPMTCQRVVIASGTIMYDTPSVFNAYLLAHPDNLPQVVALKSAGGSFGASIALGLMIRKHHLDTLIPRAVACQSGCVYAFMGGVRRTVLPTGGLYVHVNQVDPTHLIDHGNATTNTEMEANAEIGYEIKYIFAMGIRPEMLNVIFRSFGSPLPIDLSCASYLRLVNTGADTQGAVCGSSNDIPLSFGLKEEGLSGDEANALLNPGQNLDRDAAAQAQ